MRAHNFFTLISLALPAVSGHFGKAASPVPEGPSVTGASLVPTELEECESNWHDWVTGGGGSTTTMTVTVTASAVAELLGVSMPLPESSKSTSTTTTTLTVTLPAFSEPSGTSASPVESSQSDESSVMSLKESSSESPSSFTTSSPMFTNSSSDFAQSTASPSDSATSPSYTTLDCPTEPFNKTDDMPDYFGFNVVNTKPSDPPYPSSLKTTQDDWKTTFDLLTQHFPHINAVRLYSTTDGSVEHLMHAIPAARDKGLKVLVGVWSTDQNGDFARFDAEREALRKAILTYGCSDIAAISVGNEDLNQVNVYHSSASEDDKDSIKQGIADMLLNQISQIQNMTRELGCCKIPITHTDTWNEFSDISKPWIPKLIRAVDQAIIVNIFPYWSQAQIANSWQMIANQSDHTSAVTKDFGKDVWLGETGWATTQPRDVAPYNKYGTNEKDAQSYFDQVGCSILSGAATAFYYADYDEDAPGRGLPAFGLFHSNGTPILESFDCSMWKPDMRTRDYPNLPGFMGVSQAKRQKVGIDM